RAGPVLLCKLFCIVRYAQAPLQANVAWKGRRRHEIQALFAPIGRDGAPRPLEFSASIAFFFNAILEIGSSETILRDATASCLDIEIWNRASACASLGCPSVRGRPHPREREREKHA